MGIFITRGHGIKNFNKLGCEIGNFQTRGQSIGNFQHQKLIKPKDFRNSEFEAQKSKDQRIDFRFKSLSKNRGPKI